MKKLFLAAALTTVFAPSVFADNDIEFSRDIERVRGLEIIEDSAPLLLKGDSVDGSGAAEFKIWTNAVSGKENVRFINTMKSENVKGMESDLSLYVGSEKVSGDMDLDAGNYELRAKLDRDAGELKQGKAKVITVIELR